MKLKYPLNYIAITTSYKATHKAIDLGWSSKDGGKNAPVYACGEGFVTSIRDGRDNSMTPTDSGNYVTIKYNDYESRVCHLLKGSINVNVGNEVTPDTIIGKMGNSGYCGVKRGNHVHFILWKNGKRVNPIKHVYVYQNQKVCASTKREFPNLLYNDSDKKYKYIEITAKSGLWCRKGIGFSYPKYKAIPYGMKCKLIEKNSGYSNGYEWWKIEYAKEEVYVSYMDAWIKEINEK